MPIVMDNGARASVSLPLAFLSPSPCLLACFPQETRAGGWALWWPSVTFKPLPSGSFRGALWRRWGGGGMQRGPSEHRERKQGGPDRGSPSKPPVPRCTRTPLPCFPLQKSSVCQRGGGPFVRGPAAEEKGPLVVNNSAVHSDHNGGTSHCFEHLFRVGIRPLAALQRWPYIPGERLNPWVCCPANTCSQPPLLLSFLLFRSILLTPLRCLSKGKLNSLVVAVQWDRMLF